jgi:septum formation topological specificity factor MinE
VPPGSRGGPDDIAAPVQSAEESTGNLVSRQIKIMNAAERIKPGLFENITEEQIDILVKYADRIDDDLLKNIVLDPDPNNRAAAVATLEQVDALMSEGKSMDEIMSILQSTPRTKQAEGGLPGILKL